LSDHGRKWGSAIGVLGLAFLLLCPFSVRAAEVAQAVPGSHFFLHLAAGAAYVRESWRPDSASLASATGFGWGPALEVAVGMSSASGWAVGGSWQLSGIFNRREIYRGQTLELPSTLHLVDVFALLVDHAPRVRGFVHFGASLGFLVVSELDTYDGQTNSNWGLVSALHVGTDPFRAGRWSIGVLARLSVYRYGSESPPPAATIRAVLPTLLIAFSRD
jgi:hypothetical protein